MWKINWNTASHYKTELDNIANKLRNFVKFHQEMSNDIDENSKFCLDERLDITFSLSLTLSKI